MHTCLLVRLSHLRADQLTCAAAAAEPGCRHGEPQLHESSSLHGAAGHRAGWLAVHGGADSSLGGGNHLLFLEID